MEGQEQVQMKIRLILGGAVKVEPDLLRGLKASCSSAGPGAGRPSIILAFGTTRVRKVVSTTGGEFELVRGEHGLRLLDGEGVLLDPIDVAPIIHHAPDQALFNLDHRCIFGCRFCTALMPWHASSQVRETREVVDMMVRAWVKDGIGTAALTSGVPDTPEQTVARMADVVRGVLREVPGMSIGVEPYPTTKRQLEKLYSSGASEIKINLEAADASIFEKVCPRKDQSLILQMIERSGEIFGKGHVASNILIGLGEDDGVLLDAVEVLASLGCVPTLRPLQIDEGNRFALEEALGEIPSLAPKRVMELARQQGRILQRQGLSPRSFATMGHSCGCCDIRPFIDL
ncbi:MAG: radical SAM protein [Methanomassiliicoccales archaeon]